MEGNMYLRSKFEKTKGRIKQAKENKVKEQH
jgi:hypothetical protein